MLRIKLSKSLIGNNKRNRSIVAALGLKKMHHTVDHRDTPQIRGMIHKVKHMLEVTEISDADARPRTTGTPARARTSSVPVEAFVSKPKADKPKAEKPAPKAAKATLDAPKPKAKSAKVDESKPVEDATAEEKPKRTSKPKTPNVEKRDTK